MSFSEQIKQQALSLGFDACGIGRAEEIGDKQHYTQWLADSLHADMFYLERNVEKRLNPTLLVDGAKSIICVALNYYPHTKQPESAPQFAYYAYGKDYHDIVKGKLKKLLEFIQQSHPDVSGRYFCDSAPVLERYWAQKSGIGFIGKNSSLIIPGKGSYFFLGELIIDMELEQDAPLPASCGNCRKCIDACPVGAIEKPYRINANKCISYQTIENKGEISSETVPFLNNHVFGCDICQKVCPWNRFAKPHTTPEFNPSDDFLSLDLEKLQNLNEETFRSLFRQSAVKRAKLSGLKRNVEALKSRKVK